VHSPTRVGYFWFPQDSNVKFKGKLERGKFDSISLELFSSGNSLNIPKIERYRDTIIHANLENSESSEAATFIVSLNHKRETYDLSKNKYALFLNFRIICSIYGHYFPKIDDIKFNSIIIAFRNLEKWITFHDSVYVFNNDDHKNCITIDDKLIEIYYKQPIATRDQKLSVKPFDKVLYVEIKSPARMKLEAFSETRSLLLDFFNFFITGENVIADSIYGTMIENHSTIIVTIEIGFSINEEMNKSKVISPILKPYPQIHNRFGDLLARFSDFRKRGRSMYNYYFTEMYEDLPLEINVFLLAGFLESYHGTFFISKSRKKKENSKLLRNLLSNLSTTSLTGDDKDIIVRSLKDFFNKIPLRERLKELFDVYKELIAFYNPILSLASETEVKMAASLLVCDEVTKSKISNIISRKKQLDLRTLDGNERYNSLIQELLQYKNENMTNHLIECILLLSLEVFPKEISTLRNMIAHVIKEQNTIKSNIWYFLVKGLEFISQLCILSQLGFTKNEVEKIYFMNNLTLRSKIDAIISSNIYN
jgi:hypothetical protein